MKIRHLAYVMLMFTGLLFSPSYSFADEQFITTTANEYIYDSNNSDSPPAAMIAPQKLPFSFEDHGFFKIETWLGTKWVHPLEYLDSQNRRKLYADKNLTLYEQPSFSSVQNGAISPQPVTILSTQDKWYQILTYLGPRWVTLESEPKKPSKVAYMTFDDGPSNSTPQLLDTLRDYHVKATFFMIETNMRRHPDYVKRTADEGYYIGLHSVSHDVHQLYEGSPDNVAKEMKTTEDTLQSITGLTHILTRVPYGSKPYMTQEFRDDMVNYGFEMWDWNIDSEDWKYGESEKETILDNIKTQLSQFHSKNPPVILMHDRKATVEELPAIIEYLQNSGYDLITYDESHHFVNNFWNDDRL